ncbi:hypothetical protein DL765_000895 [Monosporascus sp. GIB2]|nr:hypothetical protein DL765_000895 [Monosporascus sp. GIB2]
MTSETARLRVRKPERSVANADLSQATPSHAICKQGLVRRNTSQVARPALGNVPYGVDIRSCTVTGKVALTFDDGPWQYTEDLLDILKANDVKATFFVVGLNRDRDPNRGPIDDPATGYPATLRRMHDAGHQIGSHTWSHANLETLTTEGRRDEILRNEDAFARVLGFFPTYLRPPFTACGAQCVADIGQLGYHVANYNVDTKDFNGDYEYARAVFRDNVSLRSPQDSSHIVLAHDVWEGTVHGFAEFMIDEARRAGYQLITMGECLDDPAANWYRDAITGEAWRG